MTPLLRVLQASGFLLLIAYPAWGADYHVTGEVLDAVPALAPYGVTPGAPVDVSWTVDLSTPATSVSPAPDNKSDYQGALDFLLIQIGTWTALRVAPAMGQIDQGIVSVANDSGGSLDLLHVATPGTDNDLVLHGGGVLVLSLDFYAPSGDASSDQSLDQDPSLYPIGVGSAIGTNGYVTFSIGGAGGGGGGGGSGDPTSRCAASQFAAASRLCQSRFKCESTFAKDPSKDPQGDVLDACVDQSEGVFTAAYTEALLTAAGNGLACAATAPAVDVRTAIDERVAEAVDAVNAITPAHAPLVSAWLGAAGSACTAGLKAETKNASKPDAAALAGARARARDKLEAAAEKASEKAAKANVVFDPPPDVPGFVDSVDALIDETAADLNGG